MLVNSAGRGLYAAAVACFFRESLRRQLLAFAFSASHCIEGRIFAV